MLPARLLKFKYGNVLIRSRRRKLRLAWFPLSHLCISFIGHCSSPRSYGSAPKNPSYSPIFPTQAMTLRALINSQLFDHGLGRLYSRCVRSCVYGSRGRAKHCEEISSQSHHTYLVTKSLRWDQFIYIGTEGPSMNS